MRNGLSCIGLLNSSLHLGQKKESLHRVLNRGVWRESFHRIKHLFFHLHSTFASHPSPGPEDANCTLIMDCALSKTVLIIARDSRKMNHVRGLEPCQPKNPLKEVSP